jgi:CHAT domain-containing protein
MMRPVTSIKDANSANWKVWGLGLIKAYPGFSALSSVKGELEGMVGQGGMTGQILLDDAFNEQALRSGLSQRIPVVQVASHFKFTPGPMSESYLLMGDGLKLSLEVNTSGGSARLRRHGPRQCSCWCQTLGARGSAGRA